MVTPLKAYLDAHYVGRDAEDAAEDVREIAALRADVVANALASQDARREQLLRCVPPAAARRAVRATRRTCGARAHCSSVAAARAAFRTRRGAHHATLGTQHTLAQR
jgi:hypothetical protein